MAPNERSHKGGMSLKWGHSRWGWELHSKQRDLPEGREWIDQCGAGEQICATVFREISHAAIFAMNLGERGPRTCPPKTFY